MLETIMTCLLGLEVFDPHTVMTHVEAIEAFPDRLDIHLLEGITRTVWLDEKGHAR